MARKEGKAEVGEGSMLQAVIIELVADLTLCNTAM
jgi:hypothetical protein